MKKILLAIVTASSLFATDYTGLTFDELAALRGTVSEEDKTNYQSAMQVSRQSMTPEERRSTSYGSTSGQRTMSGSGQKHQYKGSRGRR